MRTARSDLLQPFAAFHKMWQAHNHEHLLADPVTKQDYLDQLFRFKARASAGGVRFFAFCIMDNHVHECGAIGEDFTPFSDWMRVAHGTFGQRFNKRAYGETNAWTKMLDLPEAYLSLGETPAERQECYRELYEAYVASRLGARDCDTNGETEAAALAPPAPTSGANAPSRRLAWLPGNPGEGDFFGSDEWRLERQAALRRRRRKRECEARLGGASEEQEVLAA